MKGENVDKETSLKKANRYKAFVTYSLLRKISSENTYPTDFDKIIDPRLSNPVEINDVNRANSWNEFDQRTIEERNGIVLFRGLYVNYRATASMAWLIAFIASAHRCTLRKSFSCLTIGRASTFVRLYCK